MFCTKCGTQLPDGSMFCSTCGNQLNMQPTAPVMPVAPATPVMEMPVMETPVMETPVMETPVMAVPVMEAPSVNEPIMSAPSMSDPIMSAPSMGDPIMPAPSMGDPIMSAPSMGDPIMPAPSMDVPGYNPTNQYAYNAPTNIPGNVPTNGTPKKSKAPIFIGLGIGALVIAIIAIVLVLFLTGGDDNDKKKNKPTGSAAEVETTTNEKNTDEDDTEDDTEYETEDDTEDDTEEESETIDEALYEGKAEAAVMDFFDLLAAKNYSEASKYILPAHVELAANAGISEAQLAESIATFFSDSNGNLVPYDISMSFINDDYWFNSLIWDLEQDDLYLEHCSSFKTPSVHANVYVGFEYEDQYCSVTFYACYIDNQFYIFKYNDYEFTLDLGTAPEIESESESESESSSDNTSATGFEASLANNFKTLNVPVTGTVHQLDGCNLTFPDTWIIFDEEDTGYSSDYDTFVLVVSDDTPLPSTNMAEVENMYNAYCVNDNFEFGNLTINDKQGYYMEFDADGVHSFISIFFNSTNTKAYVLGIGTGDVNSTNYSEALGVLGSIEIN